jgi:cation diffusion facilitator family transporter
MSPQRRTALVSVVAALALIGIKLATGLATGSLGLVSEAAHSGTDLVAALLTFFAVGVAVRPADVGHPWGHGKAENLAALSEAAILVAVGIAIAVVALVRLTGGTDHNVDATWYAFLVIAVVMAIDAGRAVVSLRAARRYASPAFATSALHFAGDLAGSFAVLVGLAMARAGYPEGDAAAALLVATLVVAAALRLARGNVDVLMDRTPPRAEAAVRSAIENLPEVELRRLRLRRAAGRHFADVVIGVPPAGGVEQGHAAADAVEEAVESTIPGTDVVVHVEPRGGDAELRERAHTAALRVPGVREIHNIVVLELGDRVEVSLHLKLPGSMSLDEAHAVASEVEASILAELPQVDVVQTHLEPLAETASASAIAPAEAPGEEASIRQIVRDVDGGEPRQLRFLRSRDGLVVFLTLGVDPAETLAEAHARASLVEERIRQAHPRIGEVIVHTEP